MSKICEKHKDGGYEADLTANPDVEDPCLYCRIEKLEGAIRNHKLSTWSKLITDEDRVLWRILDTEVGL